ncbi:kinase-like domain-containing protein [Aspergillus taichungensis]|uniref:Kinase-like domain-containing protein n=1 Tax=Aspergillus taichungensis TaxID=482145 RepID=A0A2J5I0M2_9EURO|nr:kinase-like domain-containing protein [Aspergillus taichungensis]
MELDYTYADANEAHAIALAKNILKGITLPNIYFAGKINGRSVLVQERLPGVTLGVAWPYISQAQKQSFKQQARELLVQLHAVQPDGRCPHRSHIVQDPNILSNGRINPLEADNHVLQCQNRPRYYFLMHNDMTQSNIIVHNGKITGLIDWGMAGFLG